MQRRSLQYFSAFGVNTANATKLLRVLYPVQVTRGHRRQLAEMVMSIEHVPLALVYMVLLA